MHLSHFIIILALFLATRICAADQHPNLSAEDTDPALSWPGDAEPTGRLIVTYRPDQARQPGLAALQGDRKSTDSLHRRHWQATNGLTLKRGLTVSTDLLNTGVSREPDLRSLLLQLQQDDNVQSASIEYRRHPLLQPNDPLYLGNQTAPGNQNYLYDGEYSLQAPGGWDITTGSQNAVIAIVDTGVLPEHPELANRSIEGLGYDFVSADQPGDFSSANDGDGRDPDPVDPGDFSRSTASSWHGTGVASIAAGNSDDGMGIAGIDWNARLLHARALGIGGGTDADIIDAIRWSAGLPVSGLPANDTPATVVNLSIGGPTECTPAWQQVIDELTALGIPFVMAAGNEANNALRSSPGNCADVITVGSNTPGGDLDATFSNYGLKLTVAAPGRNIVMATNTGVQQAVSDGHSYRSETGSSFATPLVSGAISLMQSLNPDLSPAAIRSILQQSSVDFASDRSCGEYYCGAGILNLTRAMQMTRDGSYDASINEETTVVNQQLTQLDIGQTVAGTLTGYRDMRYFRVTTDQTGLLTVSSDSETDLYGYLLSDRFGVLSLDDDSHGGFDFSVASLVPAGVYYVAVERSAYRRNSPDSPFELTASLVLEQPNHFIFATLENATPNTAVASESVTINGLSSSAVVSISGGFYSLNGGDFTSQRGQVNNGDTVVVSLQTAEAPATTTRLTLTVGAYATDFAATTADAANAGSGCSLQRQSTTPDPLLPGLLVLAIAMLMRRRNGQTITAD